MSVLARCSMCHEQGPCFVYGTGTPVCSACLARVATLVDDAHMDQRLHDQVWHREPVAGCERCAVRR